MIPRYVMDQNLLMCLMPGTFPVCVSRALFSAAAVQARAIRVLFATCTSTLTHLGIIYVGLHESLVLTIFTILIRR